MSDHDATPDPMDQAYAQAEAVLNDDAARAARRARVLSAVAGEAATAAAVTPSPVRRPVWRRGGWLVAASVAGVSVFLASRVYLPTIQQQQIAPPPPVVATVAPPAASAPPQTPERASAPSSAVPRAQRPLPHILPPTAPSPPPSAEAAQDTARPPATAPASDAGVQEVIVTGQRIPAPNVPEARAAKPSGVSELVIAPGAPAASPPDRAARLRAAAAAGRTADVAALLAKGVPVDAADDDGETALMKAIQADRPAAAALLIRRGASLDARNQMGVSAREMAAARDDAELDKALGLRR